ncbi:uncharacterized protein J4E88_005286 [Alternaria novae-zelandiae]|uniref:uncharacterized protein n=1 Tax=Alternaria novae-zelandiae TaxID=430562 RepID=UPI0020C3BF28|nr:uncharacterized protein J4E88_005286 [Alternaria novae-zelandiae]KAI4682396.1 hypothetical protein J4E88_005286 [Alternaria novae-zelandiae]
MSSPATQYVYVPNLVGGQMLRIPIEDVEAEGQISIAQQPIASPTLSSRYVRDSSPSPSMESVDDTDENDGKPCTGLQSSKAELASSGRRCQAA